MSETTMQAGDDEVKVIVAAFATETDAKKKAELKAKLDAEIARRKAVEAELAKRPKPLYPVGSSATIGNNVAVVTQAEFQGTAWIYTVVINPGAFIMTKTLSNVTENDIKKFLAEHVGQVVGPAYPRGLTVFRNGQGGLIEDVKVDGATYSYQVKGWPNRVTESQLAAILGK